MIYSFWVEVKAGSVELQGDSVHLSDVSISAFNPSISGIGEILAAWQDKPLEERVSEITRMPDYDLCGTQVNVELRWAAQVTANGASMASARETAKEMMMIALKMMLYDELHNKRALEMACSSITKRPSLFTRVKRMFCAK